MADVYTNESDYTNYMQGQELEKRIHIALQKGIDTLKMEKEPFDPALHVTSIVFNLICALCFVESYEFEDPEFRRIIYLEDSLNDTFQSGFILEDFIPLLRYFPTKNFKQFLFIMNGLRIFMKKKFDEHKDSFDEGLAHFRSFNGAFGFFLKICASITEVVILNTQHEIFMTSQHLIQARKDAEEEAKEDILEQLTETHLIQTLTDIFLAGIDTSRLTLRFALFHMAQYPDIQEKVHEEIDQAVGE